MSKMCEKFYYHLKPTDSPPLRFYGQPKIHQQIVLIRPVFSYTDFPLYNLNKYIANILKAFIEEENNNAKNSTMFIRNVLPSIPEIFPLVMER